MLMTPTAAAKQNREFFVPPEATEAEPEKPRFTSRTAAEAIVAAEQAEGEIAKLLELDRENVEQWEAAEAEFTAERDRIAAELRKQREAEPEAQAARSFLLANSTPTAEEQQLQERSIKLMKERARFCATHRITEVEMVPPEETDDHQLVDELKKEVASLEKTVSNSKAAPGTSREHFQLSRVHTDLREAEQRADAYQRQYGFWQESVEMKHRQQEAYEGHQRLRKEREDGVITTAVNALSK